MGSFQCKSLAVGYTKAQAEYANLIVWQNLELQMTRNVLRLKKPLITVGNWMTKTSAFKKPPISERKSILETKTNEPQQ